MVYDDLPQKKSENFSGFLLTVFAVILHNSLAQRDDVLPSTVSTRCLARFDAKRNVDCSLPQSTRGNGRVTVRVLVARSHHNGEEEEEGCQEGRQEEEGPRLSRWLIEFFRELFQPRRNDCFVTQLPSLFRVQTRKAGPGPWAPGPA
jgi:hypothetical protein